MGSDVASRLCTPTGAEPAIIIAPNFNPAAIILGMPPISVNGLYKLVGADPSLDPYRNPLGEALVTRNIVCFGEQHGY